MSNTHNNTTTANNNAAIDSPLTGAWTGTREGRDVLRKVAPYALAQFHGLKDPSEIRNMPSLQRASDLTLGTVATHWVTATAMGQDALCFVLSYMGWNPRPYAEMYGAPSQVVPDFFVDFGDGTSGYYQDLLTLPSGGRRKPHVPKPTGYANTREVARAWAAGFDGFDAVLFDKFVEGDGYPLSLATPKATATPKAASVAPTKPAATATPQILVAQYQPREMTAAKAIGLNLKPLRDIKVLKYSFQHPAVPAAPANVYLGYEGGQLVADILSVWGMDMDTKSAYLRNQWWVGERGTGKNTVLRALCHYLGRPLFTYGCHAGSTFNAILGDFDIRQVGQGAACSDAPWLDGPLPTAVKTPFAVFNLDEYSRAGSDFGLAFNSPAMEREFLIPETGELVTFAEGTDLVVTDNNNGCVDESGQYDSAAIDRSQLDRWANFFAFDYLPADKAAEMLSKRTGAPLELAVATTQVQQALKDAADDGDSALAISARHMEAFLRGVMAGMDMDRRYRQTMNKALPSALAEASFNLYEQVMPESLRKDPLGLNKDDDDGNNNNNNVSPVGNHLFSNNMGDA